QLGLTAAVVIKKGGDRRSLFIHTFIDTFIDTFLYIPFFLKI
ncbi:MAG: hypothetical protein ACI9IT_000325, partial [Glaciecola sp.]